ncbi:MAG: ATP-binding protein [Limosilactobacillus pontis]|uniref:ATP-binding protein n=1 Tax=Limosilactobacillus pontis TaxID=35787 RepID=UPI0039A346C8
MAIRKVEFGSLKDLFSEHIDVNDPRLKERAEKRNQAMEAMYNRQAIKNKIRLYQDKSLWEGAPLEFSVKDWQPDRRKHKGRAKELGNKAYKLAHEMVNNSFNVVMSGSAGVGKTSLALMMAKILQEHNKTVMFVSTDELMRLCSDQYDYPDAKAKLKDRIQYMDKADVLILDDLGAEAGSVEQVMSKNFRGVRRDMQTLIYNVASHRFEGTKEDQENATKEGAKLSHPVRSTIITTNNIQQELERIYNSRTISRLITMKPEHRLAFNDMEDMRKESDL